MVQHQYLQVKRQNSQIEKKLHSAKLEEARLACKDSLNVYRKAHRHARKKCYSAITKENKNNNQFLFSTVAQLTESHYSIEPCIPRALNNNDFKNVFSSIHKVLCLEHYYSLYTCFLQAILKNQSMYFHCYAVGTELY